MTSPVLEVKIHPFLGAADHDQYSASSDVSNMTEFQAAKGLFEEPDNRCKVNEEDQKSSENVIDFLQLDFRFVPKI
ncbi:unnamed protein product [Brugia pahangi]|uniref:AGC-kinase C-terminal domain-containing protein n=1 Tax=Brugia pahangi TaxID=6280 RepID=A0A0N4THT5_BRUPA|nr:unnamed protein product [Brugia pahangi]